MKSVKTEINVIEISLEIISNAAVDIINFYKTAKLIQILQEELYTNFFRIRRQITNEIS